jgi:hypothetical protein
MMLRVGDLRPACNAPSGPNCAIMAVEEVS